MIPVDAYLQAANVALPIIERWREPLQIAAEDNDIDHDDRLIPWLATLVHESQRFTKLEEDLHYRAETLLTLFPLKPGRPWGFTTQDVGRYAMRPEAIANRIYGGRMGNGPESSGDGWRYRGMGPVQLTGAANRRACGEALGLDLLTNSDLLLTPEVGAASAGWFWTSGAREDCNPLADADDLTGIRRAINGGTIGLKEFIEVVEAMRNA